MSRLENESIRDPIRAITARQHGVFTRSQLLELGLSSAGRRSPDVLVTIADLVTVAVLVTVPVLVTIADQVARGDRAGASVMARSTHLASFAGLPATALWKSREKGPRSSTSPSRRPPGESTRRQIHGRSHREMRGDRSEPFPECLRPRHQEGDPPMAKQKTVTECQEFGGNLPSRVVYPGNNARLTDRNPPWLRLSSPPCSSSSAPFSGGRSLSPIPKGRDRIPPGNATIST